MKGIVAILAALISIQSYAESLPKQEVAQLLMAEKLVGRDSGETVTEDYIESCLQDLEDSDFVLECEDVISRHYIYQFRAKETVKPGLLIIDEGFSVENRQVYGWQDDEYVDITEWAWPVISYTQVSTRLQEASGDPKYTPLYVRRVAHSSYRLERKDRSTMLFVSGIPDDSRGMLLGEIRWNGLRFVLIP